MALTKSRKSVNGSASSSAKAPNGLVDSKPNATATTVEQESAEAEDVPSASTSKAVSKYAITLSQHNAAFTSLLHLIPPQFYLTKDDDEDLAAQEMMSSKYMKNKRKKAKSEVEAKERKDKMREAKKQKLDPDNFKTVTDIQTERAALKAARREAEKDSDVDMDVEGMMSDDEEDEEAPNGAAAGDTDEDFEDSDMEDMAPPSKIKLLSDVSKPLQTEGERKASIEALRAKLHAKIAGLQRKRGVEGIEEGSEDGGSTISSKDELLEERRKQRTQLRERKKQDKKDAKAAAKNKAGANGTNSNNKNVATKAPALLVPEPGYGEKTGASSSSAKFDVNSSSINFSSLDFDPVGAAAAALPASKKNRLALPSDPKAALQVLESRKKAEEAKRAKLTNKLGENSQELNAKITNYEEQKQWDKVLASATGVKIRDDEKMLKKAAKRKDKVKEKSSLAWNERALNATKVEADKQKRRTENLAARKAGSKKGKKAASSTLSNTKTPRAKGKPTSKARPGFEGKKMGRSKK